MIATLRYTLRRLLVAIVCWSGVLIGFAVLNVVGYDYVVRDSIEPMLALVESLPAPLKALVGDPNDFITPAGFLHAKFFLMAPMLLGIAGVLMGSGLIALDEEKGRLDLIAAYPIDRPFLFWGRAAAMMLALTGIAVGVWLGLSITVVLMGVEVGAAALGLACLTLWAAAAVFASAALLFSLVLPSRMFAAGAAGVVLLTSVIIENFAPTMPFLEPVADVLPLHFYQGGKAMTEFAFGPLAILLVMTAIQLGVACWLFHRRDIRVIGEGVLNVRRVSIGAAAWLGVYAVLVFGAQNVGLPSGLHRTPEEAFAAAKQAMADDHWDRVVACLTPPSRDRWTGLMVVLGELARRDGEDAKPMKVADLLSGFSRGQLRAMLQRAPDFEEAMQRVDRKQVEPYRAEMELVLTARTLPNEETLRHLAVAVDDRDAFLGETLAALSQLAPNGIDVSLAEVEVDGDAAAGRMSMFGTTTAVNFHRQKGDWKIDLPLPIAAAAASH